MTHGGLLGGQHLWPGPGPHLNGKAVSVSAGYYSSYAIMEDGSAKGWGLDGYLMGTDNLAAMCSAA